MKIVNSSVSCTLNQSWFLVQSFSFWFNIILIVVILLFSSATTAADKSSNKHFLPPSKAFSYHKKVMQNGTIKLHWLIKPGYYLYRSRLKISGVPSSVQSVQMPKGKLIHDSYLGQVHVFNHNITVTVIPGQAKKLKLSWQGCAKAGICYPPQHATLNVGSRGNDSFMTNINSVIGTTLHSEEAISSTNHTNSSNKSNLSQFDSSKSKSNSTIKSNYNGQTLAAQLASGTIGWTLLVFFSMGLLLSFTPCILPMLPILSSMIVGSNASGLRGLTLSFAFVLSMALTYALLGVAAALTGNNFQAMLQTPTVLSIFATMFFILSLSMFGLFELQLPAPLRDWLSRVSVNQRKGNIAGAAGLGIISAILVGPCMTAPLAGALLYIAQSGNVVLGGLALLSLGLGMGVPFLIVASFGAQILPQPGQWMTTVKSAFGFVLLAMALWLIQRIAPAPLMLGLWGGWLLAIALTLWHVAHGILKDQFAISIAVYTMSILLGLWGLIMVVGMAGGTSNPMQPLAFLQGSTHKTPKTHNHSASQFNAKFNTVSNPHSLKRDIDKAKAQHHWTLVDFDANWCVSCQIINHQVFSNPKVQSALAGMQLLRVDVTVDNTKTHQIMQQFNVMGPPTILFIGPNGKDRRSARVVGELSAKAFLHHLSHAKNASPKSLLNSNTFQHLLHMKNRF